MPIKVKNVPDRLADMIRAIDGGCNLKVGTSQLNKGQLVGETTKYVGKTECIRANDNFYAFEDIVKCGDGRLKTVYGYDPNTKELTRHYREVSTPRGSIKKNIDTSTGVISADGQGYWIGGPLRKPNTAIGYDSEAQKHIVIPRSTHTETVNYILGKEKAKNAYAQTIKDLAEFGE